jgi:hypothetical protein
VESHLLPKFSVKRCAFSLFCDNGDKRYLLAGVSEKVAPRGSTSPSPSSGKGAARSLGQGAA